MQGTTAVHVAAPSAAAVAADSSVRAATGSTVTNCSASARFSTTIDPGPGGGSARGSRTGESTGVFVYRGALLGADGIEENLVRHLRRWKTVHRQARSAGAGASPAPTGDGRGHLDRTPAIAYDATHGYSEYLVEAPVFLRDGREAGLVADERRAAAFPTPELATVTLNYFTAARMAEA